MMGDFKAYLFYFLPLSQIVITINVYLISHNVSFMIVISLLYLSVIDVLHAYFNAFCPYKLLLSVCDIRLCDIRLTVLNVW